MSESLQTGQFYGRPDNKTEVGGVVLTEVVHTQGRKLPQHTHESAYFGLLLSGGYAEQFSHSVAEYKPLTIGFHPPAMTHRDEIGAQGSRMFTIELRDAFLQRMRPYLTAPKFTPEIDGSDMAWLGLKLYRAFRGGDASELVVDSLCGEMLEQAGKIATTEDCGRTAWMKRALELLHGSFRESLTLEGIARQVNVHPIHLSRVFRRTQACSLGEYVNRLRMQYACRQMGKEQIPLSELAAIAGFADQSHFGRVCKSLTGSTPGKLRQVLCPAPAPSAAAPPA
jgi:AraC family transcriptional regulator